MGKTILDISKTGESPAMEGGGCGVWIRGGEGASAGVGPVIHGVFRVGRQGEGIRGDGLHAALVLVVTSGCGDHVSTPFGNFVAFEDDLEAEEGFVTGYFNFDVPDRTGFRPHGRCYIMVSLEENLSNILEVAVEK
jgi:hypothetical protein